MCFFSTAEWLEHLQKHLQCNSASRSVHLWRCRSRCSTDASILCIQCQAWQLAKELATGESSECFASTGTSFPSETTSNRMKKRQQNWPNTRQEMSTQQVPRKIKRIDTVTVFSWQWPWQVFAGFQKIRMLPHKLCQKSILNSNLLLNCATSTVSSLLSLVASFGQRGTACRERRLNHKGQSRLQAALPFWTAIDKLWTFDGKQPTSKGFTKVSHQQNWCIRIYVYNQQRKPS